MRQRWHLPLLSKVEQELAMLLSEDIPRHQQVQQPPRRLQEQVLPSLGQLHLPRRLLSQHGPGAPTEQGHRIGSLTLMMMVMMMGAAMLRAGLNIRLTACLPSRIVTRM